MNNHHPSLESILAQYRDSFNAKQFVPAPDSTDVLMAAFGITPELKKSAIQFWSRELGMCWEHLVSDLFSSVPQFGPAIKTEFGEPCDFTSAERAIDTKYRLGSGDSGTLRKLASNAHWLKSIGYIPTMLILREDSLHGAIAHMSKAGWEVLQGEDAFNFISAQSGRDLLEILRATRARGH